jgi:hypothetical protein
MYHFKALLNKSRASGNPIRLLEVRQRWNPCFQLKSVCILMQKAKKPVLMQVSEDVVTK